KKREGGGARLAEAAMGGGGGGVGEGGGEGGTGPLTGWDGGGGGAQKNFSPPLKDVELLDYKVRVLSTGEGTGASVRVLIESGDGEDRWGTVGVSHNVIEASWQALVDSIDYKLYKDSRRRAN